jgi:hypothetical protein
LRHGVATSEGNQQLGSPVIDGWRWIDRRCCRRAAAADQWWRGRGRSNSGEDRGGTGQRVARTASRGPRERAEAVGWLGDRAGSRARRWLPGGGRGRSHSGELASRAGQQASARATGVLKEWGAARVGEEKQAGVEFTAWHPWRTAAARCSRGEKTGRLYSPARGG